MNFGFLLDTKDIRVDDIIIKPLENYNMIIENFYKNANVSNGWVLPPILRKQISTSEKEIFNNKYSNISVKIFNLQSTHSISSNSCDVNKLRFLILCYGYLHGLILKPDNFLYINRIPYKISKLTGLILSRTDYEKGIHVFNSFYEKSNEDTRKSMYSILHWFLYGQTYDFEWDRFEAQYKVLDGLYKVSGLPKCSHPNRPIKLAEKFKIVKPDWILIHSKESILSRLRNNLVHEAKYAENPIGFSYPQVNFDLEFVRFNQKLINSIVGLHTEFNNRDSGNPYLSLWNLK